MLKVRFTDLTIQRLKPGYHFDEKTPSFGIRVGTNLRTWLVVRGENRTKVRLGHYPAMSLSEARKRALVTLGSPMQEKASISFPDAKEAFLSLPRWRPKSHQVLTSSLGHFQWKRQVDKINHEDVVLALDAISGQSARWHAKKDLTTFFNWCIPRYLSASPCQGLKMDAQPSRDRVLSYDELKAVWHAAEPLHVRDRLFHQLCHPAILHQPSGSATCSPRAGRGILLGVIDGDRSGLRRERPLCATSDRSLRSCASPSRRFNEWLLRIAYFPN